MSLHFTWRDTVAIIIVALAALLTAAIFTGFIEQSLAGWRIATLLLLLLGMGALVTLGPTSVPERGLWSVAGIGLSVLAIAFGFLGIVLANATVFLILLTDLALLWAIVIPTHLTHNRVTKHTLHHV